MARTAITIQDIPENAGLAATYEAANVDGNMFDNLGDEIIHVKNGGAGAINVTLPTPATQAGLAVADLVVAVPAGAERLIGRLSPGTFNQPSGADEDRVYLDYDVVTSVTVAVLRP